MRRWPIVRDSSDSIAESIGSERGCAEGEAGFGAAVATVAKIVAPAKAGAQAANGRLDSGLRRKDDPKRPLRRFLIKREEARSEAWPPISAASRPPSPRSARTERPRKPAPSRTRRRRCR